MKYSTKNSYHHLRLSKHEFRWLLRLVENGLNVLIVDGSGVAALEKNSFRDKWQWQVLDVLKEEDL